MQEGSINGKVWGTTRCLYARHGYAEMHVAHVMAGFRCSWHHHPVRTNRFCVVSGMIEVVQQTPRGTIDRTTLKPGEMLDVKAGIWHEFRVVESGVLVEVYFIELDGEDIVREKLGGRIEEAASA